MNDLDKRLIFARNKIVTIRLELLDSLYQVVEELQGKAVQFSIETAGDSDIRRTASLTLALDDEEAGKDVSKKVWLDNMVRAYVKIEDADTEESKEYLVGSFLFVDRNYQYDATTQKLSLSLADLMASSTSARGNQIDYDTIVPAGSNMRNALISTVGLFSPFKRYNVPEFEDTVYYDVEVGRGSYGHDILAGLLAMHPTYEQFYSQEGVYTVQPIPTKIEDEVEADTDIMDNALIADGGSDTLSDIANVISIWGKEIEPDYVATSCVTEGNAYVLDFSSELTALEVNARYSFTPTTDSVAGQMIKIQNLKAYPIYNQAGDGTETAVTAKEMGANRNYAVQYAGEKFYLMGETFIHVIAKEVNEEPTEEEKDKQREDDGCRDIVWVVNPDSPYAVDKIGEIKKTLIDGEYADIYTTQLAYERAKYELWKRTRKQNKVTLNALLIPTLDVNTKIAYTSTSSGEREEYLVQSISADYVTFTMELTAVRFYPYYPF